MEKTSAKNNDNDNLTDDFDLSGLEESVISDDDSIDWEDEEAVVLMDKVETDDEIIELTDVIEKEEFEEIFELTERVEEEEVFELTEKVEDDEVFDLTDKAEEEQPFAGVFEDDISEETGLEEVDLDFDLDFESTSEIEEDFDINSAEDEYDGPTVTDFIIDEDEISEFSLKDDNFEDERADKNDDSDINLDMDLVEKSLEKIVRRLFAEKIDAVLTDIIQKSVTKELESLKDAVFTGEEMEKHK